MLLLTLLVAAALNGSPSDTASAGTRPTARDTSRGPTLAVEDTMHTEVPEVLVRAPRVTLDEILDRVALGEMRRDMAIDDLAFTATLRVVSVAHGKAGPRLLEEDVFRVLKKKPNRVRSILLRHWDEKSSDKGDVDANFTPNTAEEIVNFAFQPQARRDFRYHILGRDLLGDHLIYRIAFEPRSQVGLTLPGGMVWVDTKDFVIVRQELSFARSPIPLLIRGLDRAVIERTRMDGHWVLHRIMVRAGTTVPVPKYGRTIDFAMRFDDYAVNRGIADSLFTSRARR